MIDWSALSQIDAPRCVDFTVNYGEVILFRPLENYCKSAFVNSERQDLRVTVDVMMLDSLDALFDEAAGCA